jgi:myosin heavy subunit
VFSRGDVVLIKFGTVLQAIKLRYAQKEIYTYSGIVLIATNPFAKVDSLYVDGMVQVYTGKSRASQAPHLFAIAEEAFSYVSIAILQIWVTNWN